MAMMKQAFAVLLGMLVLGWSSSAWAQAQPDPNAGNNAQRGNNRPGRGGFDPAQFRQQRMDDLKQQLDVKDDEWTVIQPKLEKVMTLSFERMRGGAGMFRRNRGNDQNRPNPQADTAIGRAQADLQSALTDKSISPDEVAKRLGALRAAKDAQKQDLVKAQQDLKELLSQRQEAVLVLAGYLD
jgi:hypothetical protein